MEYVKFAFRNLKRHYSRTVVTIFTISLGFVALGILGGVVTNIFSRLKGQAIVVEKLGHITIAKKGFFDNHKIHPENYIFTKNELNEVLKISEEFPEIRIATPRLSIFGMANNGISNTIFLSEAIEPLADSILQTTVIDGRSKTRGATTISNTQDNLVAIGSELANNLNLKIGDNLTLFTNTIDGMANAVDVEIEKIYNTGNPATNDKFILTNLKLIQELYDTNGADRIVLLLEDETKIQSIKTALIPLLQSKGIEIEAKPWDELSLFYSRVTKMFGIIFRVLTVIISVVVLLTLLNTMQMSVNERTREIGTLRAVGMTKSKIIKVFVIEAVIISILGALFAMPLLYLVKFILDNMNITFIPPVGSAPVPITLIFKVKNILLVAGLFSLASIISSYLASRKIAGQQIIQSLLKFN